LVIEAYVKAYQTAELDEQMARMEKLSDGEQMKIAMGGHAAETVSPVAPTDSAFALMPRTPKRR
jgi:hypothetical protein